jgi:hypothetical protein
MVHQCLMWQLQKDLGRSQSSIVSEIKFYMPVLYSAVQKLQWAHIHNVHMQKWYSGQSNQPCLEHKPTDLQCKVNKLLLDHYHWSVHKCVKPPSSTETPSKQQPLLGQRSQEFPVLWYSCEEMARIVELSETDNLRCLRNKTVWEMMWRGYVMYI